MELQQAIEYLKKVLIKWEAFCKGHSRFAKALQVFLNNIENKNNK